MARVVYFALLVLSVVCLLPPEGLAQGETTSAIVGEVRDATNAVVPGATVTIANPETGLRRSAKTDEAGRFNFPQLKPGTARSEADHSTKLLQGVGTRNQSSDAKCGGVSGKGRKRYLAHLGD